MWNICVRSTSPVRSLRRDQHICWSGRGAHNFDKCDFFRWLRNVVAAFLGHLFIQWVCHVKQPIRLTTSSCRSDMNSNIHWNEFSFKCYRFRSANKLAVWLSNHVEDSDSFKRDCNERPASVSERREKNERERKRNSGFPLESFWRWDNSTSTFNSNVRKESTVCLCIHDTISRLRIMLIIQHSVHTFVR